MTMASLADFSIKSCLQVSAATLNFSTQSSPSVLSSLHVVLAVLRFIPNQSVRLLNPYLTLRKPMPPRSRLQPASTIIMQSIISLLFLLAATSSGDTVCHGDNPLRCLATGTPWVVPGADTSQHSIRLCTGKASKTSPYACTGSCCAWTGLVNKGYGSTAYIGNDARNKRTVWNCLETDGATEFNVADDNVFAGGSSHNYTFSHPWYIGWNTGETGGSWVFNTLVSPSNKRVSLVGGF